MPSSDVSLISTQHIEAALFKNFSSYKEEALFHRRFRHQDLAPLLAKLIQAPGVEVSVVGQSVEQRDISLVKIGTGPTRVLLWSQMHGDEATATMALFDLFRFFTVSDEFDFLRREILAHTTLYVVPMLNPDGAERQQRRNALDVDLNREALRLQSPEARLLKQLVLELQPAFGFNLHDQNPHYSVGDTGVPAAISFLAPPYNVERSVNAVRSRAMRLIVHLNRCLQSFIPGRIGKWSDEFEPRAFGDNIQKWGTSVVLLESGGYPHDPEKQFIRQLNFVALLTGLQAIATQSYEAEDLQHYDEIPPNGPLLFDLILRNVAVEQGGQVYVTDVGIVRDEQRVPGATQLFYRGTIQEIGDMSLFSGYEERDVGGLQMVAGKVYTQEFADVSEVATTDLLPLLRQGYLFVRVKNSETDNPGLPLPINVIRGEAAVNLIPGFEKDAHFVLLAEGEPRMAVVNGFLYDLHQPLDQVHHGRILP